jgi:DNA-3-methyladenine glycosylase I
MTDLPTEPAAQTGHAEQSAVEQATDSVQPAEPPVAAQPIRTPWADTNPLLTTYYDTEWGMPTHNDRDVFERLTLEAFQSGLSWLTILKRRESFRAAFDNFDYSKIAQYTEADIERLLQDTGIIRNRAKIVATVGNAQAALALEANGGLAEFVWSFKPEATPEPATMADVPSQSPESVALSKALKKLGFRFVGPTTVFALMEALGIVDTHIMTSHRRGASGIWPR